MNKHTPGPWSIGDDSNAGCEVIAGPVAIVLDRIARVAGDGTYVISREEMIANARLIAAAPCMLQALEAATAEIRAIYGDQPPATNSVVMLIEAAIKKARGEE